MAAQRDALDDLERLRVDDVERALRFVADVDAAAVRRRADAVVDLDPSMTPTTLLVAGSMTWTLSPALLVWMIRTFLSRMVLSGSGRIVHSMIAAGEREHRDESRVSVRHDRQPFSCCSRVCPITQALGASATRDRSARRSACRRCDRSRRPPFLGQRMHEQLALHAAWHGYAPDHIEVLARLFVGPGRRARVERLQAQRRARPWHAIQRA